MLTNYHTHTTFCDGGNTAEEMVLCAIEKGFDALGFSGHGYTKMDSSFCMRDTDGYISTVRALQNAYKDKLQIYLGVEEDMIHPVKRSAFDYIIGSSHYICINGVYYSVDGSQECYQNCLALFDGDPLDMARAYYEPFCDYIMQRKPDIVGHFDLLTKYDEVNGNALLQDKDYLQLAEEYMLIALRSDCIFEVNTGAVARGIRTTQYPCEQLLHLMKKQDAKLILSSDCHSSQMLDCYFKETKALLREIGFRKLYVLYNGHFQGDPL